MEGISKKRLEEIAEDYPPDHRNHRMAKQLIDDECRELKEPWMTLDEFLKSGFEGLCWVCSVYKDIFAVQFIDDNFISINTGAKAQLKYIERVMPIHKPELPK